MKYTISDYTTVMQGSEMHRIQACKDFVMNDGTRVRKGDLGGWVYSEDNLSQEGTCWISDEAGSFWTSRVEGDAHVFGEAIVSANARVYGNARVGSNAHICMNACVYGNAYVYDNAYVYGNAQIYGNSIVGNPNYNGKKDYRFYIGYKFQSQNYIDNTFGQSIMMADNTKHRQIQDCYGFVMGV